MGLILDLNSGELERFTHSIAKALRPYPQVKAVVCEALRQNCQRSELAGSLIRAIELDPGEHSFFESTQDGC